MDNLTHSLVGAVLGQTGLKTKTGLAMPALIIGANLPDVDAACFFWLEGTEHLGFRRGITHGPPAMVLLPLILAGLLWGYDRWQDKRGKRPEDRLPVNFKWLFLLSFIGCLSHPALDWLNVYGIRLLEPFSSQWFYGDTLFIIDVWLWALLGLTWWWSARKEKNGGDWRKSAWIGVIIGLVYIAVNGIISEQASHEVSMTYSDGDHSPSVVASPIPLEFWKRETITLHVLASADTGGMAPSYSIGDWSVFGGLRAERRIPEIPCVYPASSLTEEQNSKVAAFLLWTRKPISERSEDGSVVLHDARFYDPRARDRFSVALPDVECEELPAE